MTVAAAPWRAREAVLALGVGAALSFLGALTVLGGGLSTIEVFAVVMPLQEVGTLGCAFILARRRGRTPRALGLRGRWSDLVGVAVGAGVQLVGSAVAVSIVETFFGGEVPGQEVVTEAAEAVGVGVRLLVVLGLVIVGPIAEEVVFRGMLLPSLLGRGRRWAVGVSSFWFAAAHLVDPGALFFTPFLFVLAVILCNETLRTGRLGRPIAIHAGFNLVTVIGVFLA